jgi:trans-2,3-dihydro-3-hydroxyanthranilate isomerase
MKQTRVITLDAFTTKPFAGNPCAVVPDASGLTEEQMQIIARETNLPETAFVLPSEKANFRVRYFTPRYEINFAGHPTIATSFMLGLEKMVPLKEPVTTITLEFNIGVLPVDIHMENGQVTRAVMTQQLPTFGKQFSAEEVAPCFNLAVADLRDDCLPQVVGTGVEFLMVPAKNLDVLGKVKMDRDRLAALLQNVNLNAAFMFSIGGFSHDADTHARLFDPKGTFEDPYTGSAAGAMGSYIVRYGLKKGPILHAEQGNFVGRPGLGILEIKSEGDKILGVRLGGAAVKVMDGWVILE